MNNKFNVYFFPMGDVTMGSSRVRVYYLDKYIKERGIESRVIFKKSKFISGINFLYLKYPNKLLLNAINIETNKFLNALGNNHLKYLFFFQKRKDVFVLNIMNQLKTYKYENTGIIFDIVDQYHNDFSLMIKQSDLVTTASESMKHLIEKDYDGVKVAIVRQFIDYIYEPLPKKIHVKDDGLKIVFDTSPQNLKDILVCAKALQKLSKKRNFTLSYISGKKPNQILSDLRMEHVTWNPDTITSDLQKFDLAIAPQTDYLKPRSKLLTAISHNLPVVCSDVPSYRSLAESTNTLEFVCNTQKDWYEALNNMFNPETRNEYLSRTLPWIWKYHGKEHLTQEWINAFNQI